MPPDGATTITRIIAAINTQNKTLTLNANHGIDIPQYSSVRIDRQNDVYTNYKDYFTMSYGNNTNGNGGTFIKYESLLSNNIPKYSAFPDDKTMFAYCLVCFNKTGIKNIFQLVAAKAHVDGSMGTAYAGGRQAVVTYLSCKRVIIYRRKYQHSTPSLCSPYA